jgi:uncharacterized paraquat-inducible protein A
MVKIDELMAPGEVVIKKQGGVTVMTGEVGMPTGDLFLTNTRLMLIPGSLWALVLPDPETLLRTRGFIQILLQDIKTVDKSVGNLKVKADKEYNFAVSLWQVNDWVDKLQKARSATVSPITQPQTQQSSAGPAPQQPATQSEKKRYCFNCGSPVRQEAQFCESCGTRLK